jgi:hypothetical protein
MELSWETALGLEHRRSPDIFSIVDPLTARLLDDALLRGHVLPLQFDAPAAQRAQLPQLHGGDPFTHMGAQEHNVPGQAQWMHAQPITGGLHAALLQAGNSLPRAGSIPTNGILMKRPGSQKNLEELVLPGAVQLDERSPSSSAGSAEQEQQRQHAQEQAGGDRGGRGGQGGAAPPNRQAAAQKRFRDRQKVGTGGEAGVFHVLPVCGLLQLPLRQPPEELTPSSHRVGHDATVALPAAAAGSA